MFGCIWSGKIMQKCALILWWRTNKYLCSILVEAKHVCRRDVVGSLLRGMPTVVDYRWRCARQRTIWWRKMNTRFIQVRATNYVISYVLYLCGLYWYVMMMCFEGVLARLI
jgi:hypothetical protein